MRLSAPVVPVRLATAAMGTRFELVLGGESPERWRAAGEAALDEIEQCHRRLNRFASDSLIAHINRTAHSRPVRLDADTFTLFEDALDVQQSSGGAFDIAVGQAMDAWLGGVSRAPVDAPHDRANAAAPSFELDASARTIRLTRPGTRLDLGAIAKGHALELAARGLREHGVTCALLHGGTSSVVAIGAPPATPGWRIALGRTGRGAGVWRERNGWRAGGAVEHSVGGDRATIVVLRDRALSVSSPSGRTMDSGGSVSGHILDARSGAPAPLARFVAVVGPCARQADAWSTAIGVLGARPASLGDEWLTWMGLIEHDGLDAP